MGWVMFASTFFQSTYFFHKHLVNCYVNKQGAAHDSFDTCDVRRIKMNTRGSS